MDAENANRSAVTAPVEPGNAARSATLGRIQERLAAAAMAMQAKPGDGLTDREHAVMRSIRPNVVRAHWQFVELFKLEEVPKAESKG